VTHFSSHAQKQCLQSLVSLLLLFMHDEGLLMNFHCKHRMCFLNLHNVFCPPGESAEQILKIILPYRSMHQAQRTLTWPMVVVLTSTQFILLNLSVFWVITAEDSVASKVFTAVCIAACRLILLLEMNEDVKSSKTLTSKEKFTNRANREL